MVAQPDLSVFSRLRSKADYDRLQEDFDTKKLAQQQAAQLGALQVEQAKKQLSSPDLETLAQQSLYAYHQGQPMTPEGEAALRTLATLEGNKVTYKPDAWGTVRAQTEPNPYDLFLSDNFATKYGTKSDPIYGSKSDPMAASREAIARREAEIGANPYQSDLEVMPMTVADIEGQLGTTRGQPQGQMMENSPAFNMEGAQNLGQSLEGQDFYSLNNIPTPAQLDPRATSAPEVQMAIAKEAGTGNLKLANEMKLKVFDQQLKSGETQKKSTQAQSVISTTLNELENLNDQLKVKNAIVNNDQNALQNLQSAMGSSAFGQAVAQIQNIDIQTLRNQYNLARDSLIPFYVDYFDLPATMVDTEEMSKRIIQSFGDPTLDYTANKTAIDRMRGQFGIENIDPEIKKLIDKYAD
jgi:hypothetical protein